MELEFRKWLEEWIPQSRIVQYFHEETGKISEVVEYWNEKTYEWDSNINRVKQNYIEKKLEPLIHKIIHEK